MKNVKRLIVLLLGTLLALFFCACDTSSKVVTGMEIGVLPTKTAYFLGEECDLSGGEITVSFEDGKSNSVSMTDKAVSISGFSTASEAVSLTVTVLYAGFTDTFSISVSDREKVEEVTSLIPNLPAIDWSTPHITLTTAQKQAAQHCFDKLVALSEANVAGIGKANFDQIVSTAFYSEYFTALAALNDSIFASEQFAAIGSPYLGAQAVQQSIAVGVDAFNALMQKYTAYSSVVLYSDEGVDYTIDKLLKQSGNVFNTLKNHSSALLHAVNVYVEFEQPIKIDASIAQRTEIGEAYEALQTVPEQDYNATLRIILGWNPDYITLAFYHYFNLVGNKIEKQALAVVERVFPEYSEVVSNLATLSTAGFLDNYGAPLFLAIYNNAMGIINRHLEGEFGDVFSTFYNEIRIYRAGLVPVTIESVARPLIPLYNSTLAESLPNLSEFKEESLEFLDAFFDTLYNCYSDSAFAAGNVEFDAAIVDLVTRLITVDCWDKYEFYTFHEGYYFDMVFNYFQYYLGEAFDTYMYLLDASMYYMEYQLGTPNTLDFLASARLFELQMQNLSTELQQRIKTYAAAEYDYYMGIYESHDVPASFFDLIVIEARSSEALMLAISVGDLTFFNIYVEQMFKIMSPDGAMAQRIRAIVDEETSIDVFFDEVWIGEGSEDIKEFMSGFWVETGEDGYTYAELVFEYAKYYATVWEDIPQSVANSLYPAYIQIAQKWINAGGSINSEENIFLPSKYSGNFNADVEALLDLYYAADLNTKMYFLLNFEVSFQLIQISYYAQIFSQDELELWFGVHLSFLYYLDNVITGGFRDAFEQEINTWIQFHGQVNTTTFDNSYAYKLYQYVVSLLDSLDGQ